MIDFIIPKEVGLITTGKSFSVKDVSKYTNGEYEVSKEFDLILYEDEELYVNKNLKIIWHREGGITIKNVHKVIPNMRCVFLV